MNIRAKDLITLEKCEKMYNLNRLMETEKNQYYYISIAIRNTIKDMLTENNLELAIRHNKVEEKVEEYLPDSAFLPLVKDEVVRESTEHIERYLRFLKENNYKLLKADTVQDINLNGELITVSADFVFKKPNNQIEIVKIKRTEPSLSYRARVFDSFPKNNIELYLLQLMGEHLYPNKDVLASFHHMTAKGEKKNINPEYEFKKGHNIISCNFSENRDEINKRISILAKTTKGKVFKETEDGNKCRMCPFNYICNHKKQDMELEVVKKQEKAPNDFKLTKAQFKAVTFSEGVARINAGAGSGKTTIVALRVVELIMAGYEPEDILLITFTNKGAEEMRDKIGFWLKKEGMNIEVNRFNILTFNAWGDKIIMENYKELGFTETPQLINKVEKYDIIFEILNDSPRLHSFDYKNPVMDYRYYKGVVAKLSSFFDFIKAYNPSLEKFVAEKKIVREEAKLVFEMYQKYNKVLRKRNLIEYQDQMSLIIELINEESPILDVYNYKHIIVDEFQDTDAVQLDIVMFLANQPAFKSLMVVGDDSQSIFGFRNTSQENILDFHKLFKETKDIEIVENFRSTPEIVELANGLNNYNQNKIDKKLVSGAQHGDVPLVMSFKDSDSEYEFISNKIEELLNEYNPEDIAIIARTKFELFEIEKNLKEKNIPYVMDVPEPMLNNINTHMAKSLAVFIDNPQITQGMYEYLFVADEDFIDESDDEVLSILEEYRIELEEALEIDINTDEETRDKMKREIFFTLLGLIEDETLKYLIKDLERKETFRDIKDYLDKFIEYEDNKSIDKNKENYRAVTLTTAHTSKGKEFPVVFNTISKYKADRDIKSIE